LKFKQKYESRRVFLSPQTLFSEKSRKTVGHHGVYISQVREHGPGTILPLKKAGIEI